MAGGVSERMRITPDKVEDVATRMHLERDGFDDPNMDNPVYAAMTEAEFLLRVLVAQMKTDEQKIERLRSAVDEARKALYSNVECDCRDTLTFDCWKCNLMRELNKVMGQTPPPAATAPPADR